MRIGDQTVAGFCEQLAAATPAPGGGAAAAAAGALGAALVAMVAGLTVGREKYAAVQEEMASLQESGRREMAALLQCADDDQAAFNQVMAALGMPKGTDAEKAARRQALEDAYKQATRAPLETMRHSLTVMQGALAAAGRGNTNAVSDAYAGFLMAQAAFEGALWNVAINLGSLKDEAFKQEIMAEIDRLRAAHKEVARAMHALTPDPVVRFTRS
jgi:formiminotetrahydrofolate cyclodeaminase